MKKKLNVALNKVCFINLYVAVLYVVEYMLIKEHLSTGIS